MRLTGLAFNDWIEHAFSHEVRFQAPAWFFDQDCDFWDPAPVGAVNYLTRLFEHPVPALRYFSDDQLAQGLTYLVSTSASGDNGWLYSTDVSIKMRVRCVESVANLFSEMFAPRCTPHLSHLSERRRGRSMASATCGGTNSPASRCAIVDLCEFGAMRVSFELMSTERPEHLWRMRSAAGL